MRSTRGLRYWAIRLMVPPLPAADVARRGLRVGSELRLDVPTEHVRVRPLA